MQRFVSFLVLLTVLAPLLAATGCAADSSHDLKMAPMNMLPAKNVPCYCGCGANGHTSNYSCYVKQSKGDGTYIFDEHALGCSVCVDITQDVMRYSRAGKSPGDIHAAIVSTYSQFGPANQ